MGTTGTLKSSVGLGSGIEIESLVNQLVDLEGKYETEKLNKDQVSTEAKITAYGNIKGALSDLKDAVDAIKTESLFEEYVTSISNDPTVSADTAYFSASATSEAVSGKYTIEIEQLAQAHKLSKSFNTASQIVGTGTLRIEVGAGQSVSKLVDYSINSDNNTVTGIKNLINSTSNQTGVVATIVTSDDGVNLVISSKETGVKNTLDISVLSDSDGDDEDDAGLSQLITANMTVASTAQDTNVRIDGQLVTSSKTKLVDAIDGITLDLKKAEDSKVHTLSVSVDEKAIKDKMKNYVEKYNEVVDLISEATRTSPSSPELSGDLVADANIRLIESRLRNSLSFTKQSRAGIISLANIGITSDGKTGKLILNDSKYDSVTGSDMSSVISMLTGASGVASNQSDLIDSLINADGTITRATNNLNDNLGLIVLDKAKLNYRLESQRFYLTTKFASLDALLGGLQSTGSFLQQQLDGMVDPLAFKK